MNRYLTKLWIVPLLGLGATGCDGLLEENPLGELSPVGFYQSEADAINAVNGAYSILQDGNYLNGLDYVYMVEMPTPQFVAYNTADRGRFDTYRHLPSNQHIINVWRTIYQGINWANAAIDNIPRVPEMNPGLRARLLAEARFLRAFHYFNLVRLFGGVPLMVKETSDLDDRAVTRSTADEVYARIIRDLTEIQGDLPPSYPASEYGRATRGAAQALLGKVYLQRGVAGQDDPYGDDTFWPNARPGDLQAAEAELRKVVQSGRYSLVPRYRMMWQLATERNSEVIFAVNHIEDTGHDMNVTGYFLPVNSAWGTSFVAGGAELPFWQSYAPGDERRDATWLPEYTETNGTHHDFRVDGSTDFWPTPNPRKYIDETQALGNPHDLIVLRYGDVLLMLAEVLWRQNPGSAEALRLVNQVRARAKLAPLTTLTEEALYWERNWELASEQHAWYDGQRFWRLFSAHVRASSARRGELPVSTVPLEPVALEDPKHRLMPIPREEVDRNPNLVQNPGW